MQCICLNIGMLQTNCYVVYDDDKVGAVIDPGGNEDRIIEVIRKNNLKITHILLTHAHFDHLLAADAVRAETGAALMVSTADRSMLENRAYSMIPPHITIPIADELFDDKDEIKTGGLTFKVMHTPGHTPGSCCFKCENVLFSGDTLFESSIGRVDFPGGDAAAMECSLAALSELDGGYTVLPGHGGSTTIEREKANNPYLKGFYK